MSAHAADGAGPAGPAPSARPGAGPDAFPEQQAGHEVVTADLHTAVALHGVEEDVDAILRDRVAALLAAHGTTAENCPTAGNGPTAADVRIGRHCPRCGSSEHGRPWARVDGRAGARVEGRAGEVGVSLSRSGPHLVTAVREEGPIGVDIEQIRAVDERWRGDLVLHPSERGLAGSALERARMWCRKEAILKALGVGLAREMTTIAVADYAVDDVPAPPGYVAARAII